MSSRPGPSFGTLLKRHRRALNLTQEALGERAGISVVTVSALERGVNVSPRQETIDLLADALALAPAERAHLQAAARGLLRADGLAPPSLRLAAAGASLPPLVGRREELAQLARHLEGSGPPVLLLAGEPGIGKTRLLYEAVRHAVDRGWRLLEGGCHRRGGQDPYTPVLGALERLLQQQSLAERRLALEGCTWLVKLLPELAETALVSPPRWQVSPEQEQRLMFAAVRRLLANVAGPAGTLLVLDDLHWAGSDALDLLTTLLRTTSDAPLRVVGAYRSTDVRPQHPLARALDELAHDGLAAETTIGPLAPAEAAELVMPLLSGMAEHGTALVERVAARAGGIPYFLVSCAQALQAGVASEALPWEVAQSIRQQVAALPGKAQELLGLAAVAGRRVERTILLTWSPPDREDGALLAALEAACQARLLVEAGEGAYQFPHDLVREVVATDLSAARRASLHGRVAHALEQLPWAPPIERLAFHYSRAGDTARAARYLEQAGDRAWALHANADAERAYHDLLTHLERLGLPVELARASEKLEQVLETLGRHAEALAVLERALACYHAAGDLEAERRVLAQMARPYHGLNRNQEGIARLLAHLEASTGESPTPSLVRVQAALAWLYRTTHQYQQHLSWADRALEQARRFQDEMALLQAQRVYALALGHQGRIEEALPVFEAQVRLSEAVGDLWTLGADLRNLTAHYVNMGAYTQGRRAGARALEVAEQLGDLGLGRLSLATMGWIGVMTGDWVQARRDLEQAVQLDRQLVGHAANEAPFTSAAPDPPSRRNRARTRRCRRSPFQTKAVGVRFQPATVSSSQSITCWAVSGCWPANARRTRIRCTDSAMFNHDPESGVYSGSTPCSKSQPTRSGVRWPARLSQMRTIRKGGSGPRGGWPNQVSHRA